VSVLAGDVRVVRGAGRGPGQVHAEGQRGASGATQGAQVPQGPGGRGPERRRTAAEHRAFPDRRPRRRAG